MPIELMQGGGAVVSGPEGMKFMRLLSIRSGLKLELHGMRLTRRGPSCFSIAKKEFGLKGSKLEILEKFEKLLKEQSAKVPRVLVPIGLQEWDGK